MHRWSGILVVLLVAAVLPAAGQEAPSELADDEAGDVAVYASDDTMVGSAPAGHMQNLDLLALGVATEDPDMLVFYLEVVDLRPDSEVPVPLTDPQYEVRFSYHEADYRVLAFVRLDNAFSVVAPHDNEVWARLQEAEGERWRTITEVEAEADFQEERLVLRVPKGAIVDEDHTPLDKGALLSKMSGRASALGFLDFSPSIGGDPLVSVTSPYAEDLLPDTGVVEYEVRTGVDLHQGQVFSSSDDPVRWTNGEATTLAYQIALNNRGDEDVELTVATEGVPSSWSVARPDRIQVPAGSAVNTTLLVSIPFSHAHGSTQEFFAVFRADDQFTKTRLGVHWPAIPQPAGHHDTLSFHSRFSAPDIPVFDVLFQNKPMWVNAASPETDEDDEGLPVPGRGFGLLIEEGQPSMPVYWSAALGPQLRMGLDFDLERQGVFSGAVEVPTGIVDPSIRAQVRLVEQVPTERGYRIEHVAVLAEGRSEVMEGPQTGTLRFEVPLSVAEDADLIEYRPGLNLRVDLRLDGVMPTGPRFFGPETTEPMLLVDQSTIQLPLFEYHDPVDDLVVTDRALHITSMDQEREVNPGKAVLYRFPVHYQGDFADRFEVRTSGNGASWAEVVGDDVVGFRPDQEREVAILVRAPEDARAGQQADVTITVRSTSNAAVEAHVRTLTTVVTDRDIPDESDAAVELAGDLQSEESPGVPLLVLLAGMVVLVLRRRG